MIEILQGNCLDILPTLLAGSVQCCVTSPPYWGLRDYGVPGQLGLEETPEDYVASLLAIMRQVWRVLRDDGTLWLNLGDCYASSNNWSPEDQNTSTLGPKRDGLKPTNAAFIQKPKRPHAIGLKPKDLVGIPWHVAFALQAEGWFLRSDIIWHKPNPMPESVTDRPTKAHEYIFLLTKRGRYFYDAEAITEASQPREGTEKHLMSGNGERAGSRAGLRGEYFGDFTRRNRRTVWTITPQPYLEAHFATFPSEIPKVCILAGTKPGDTVLDPFAGSGTTLQVALELGRRAIGIELNPAYIELIRTRTQTTIGFF
jgi:DNA modification methylase